MELQHIETKPKQKVAAGSAHKHSSRKSSIQHKEKFLERYKESDTEDDIETSFYHDSQASLDSFFETKISDWKLKKHHRNSSMSTSNSKLGDHAIFSKKENLLSRSNSNSSFVMPQSPTKSKNYDFRVSNKENYASPQRQLSSSEVVEGMLQNYEIKERLGKGAFASVFRATNKISKKDVAIKQIDLNTEDDIMELMTEINLLKTLKHVNIVKYHGYIQRNHVLNIFLEYCDKGSLRDLYKRIKKSRSELSPGSPQQPLLSESEIVYYMKQVLEGLTYLHSEGVVHRDIKAANILVTSNKIVKLADFGVSARINANTVNLKSSTAVGTPNWMAPEIITLDKISTASDIWSLGATVIEIYTGSPPYSNLNAMAALHAIVSDKHPPIPETFSPLAKDFLIRCFEKNPEDRDTAKELRLHAWMNIEHKIVNSPITVRSPRSRSHRRNLSSGDSLRKISISSGDTTVDSVKFGRYKKLHNRSTSSSSASYNSHLMSTPESTPVKLRNPSQTSSLTKYMEKDYELDDWDKDFANLNIDDSFLSNKFKATELPSLLIKKK